MVFDAKVDGTVLNFGVSGLLYNSDVLFDDRNTGSLWSQILSQSVSGPMKSVKLKQLPAFRTTWANWLAKYPDTEVISLDGRSTRDYNRNPYVGYEKSKRLYFPVNQNSKSPLRPKETVPGVSVADTHKAYPPSVLTEQGSSSFEDKLGNQVFRMVYDVKSASAHVLDEQGSDYASTTAFWFAWYTFHPQTELFELPE